MKCGYPLLIKDINRIIKKNEKKKYKDETEKNKNGNNILMRQNKNQNRNNLQSKSKKNKTSRRNVLKTNNAVISRKTHNFLNINEAIEKNGKKTKTHKKKHIKNIYELNMIQYPYAIIYDKRSCFKYYLSLTTTKQPIIFAFCPIKDYNSKIIKLCLFFLFFSINYAINLSFFNEDIIHKIFEENGKYDIIYFLPQILISFLVTHISSIILKLLFLSERNIVKIKQHKQSAYSMVESLERTLIIKYIIFYISSILFLIFFWMLLSSFGAVYQNTQYFVFKNTLVSFSLSLVYPFFFNIIPSIFRFISLKSESNSHECLYNFSKFIQLL